MHLIDYFIDVIAYVVYLVKTVEKQQAPFDQVRSDILRLLSKSEESVQMNVYSPEEYEQAHFVVCAWIDETILASSWSERSQWQTEQLQRKHYNTFEAGEEVFERLNKIGYQQHQVREVYYLCLSLGFKGKFIHPEDDYLLEQLRTSNLKLLLGSSTGLPSLERMELFPEAFPSGTIEMKPRKRRFEFNLFTSLALVGPAAFFCLLFSVYYFSLNGVAKHILEMVP
jgi:type VI secretion system protein ImpK